MLKLFFNLFRENILIGAIILVLGFWASFATVIAIKESLKNEAQYLVIGEGSEPKYISNQKMSYTQSDLPKSTQEILKENFLLKFILSCFSYNDKTFVGNFKTCKNLITRKLLIAHKKRAKNRFKQVVNNKIQQVGELDSVKQLSNKNEYEINIKVFGVKNKEMFTKKRSFKLKLKEMKPSVVNPYGYQVEVINEAIM